MDKLALKVVSRHVHSQTEEVAVAPPEWEDSVKKMKKHPEIDNPWALAWYMKNKGYTPHNAASLPKDKFLSLAKEASLAMRK